MVERSRELVDKVSNGGRFTKICANVTLVTPAELERLWKQRIADRVTAGTNVKAPILSGYTLEEFKVINRGKDNFDNFVNNISEVSRAMNYGVINYEIKFRCGRRLTFDTMGNIQKYNVNGKKTSTTSRYNKGHVILKERVYANSDLTLERLVYTAECILTDNLPVTFDNTNVNCMDLCGNLKNKLGVPYNVLMHNLELIEADDNLRHSDLAHEIYKITGKAYRFTARDYLLRLIVSTKPQFIEWYMDICGYPQI